MGNSCCKSNQRDAVKQFSNKKDDKNKNNKVIKPDVVVKPINNPVNRVQPSVTYTPPKRTQPSYNPPPRYTDYVSNRNYDNQRYTQSYVPASSLNYSSVQRTRSPSYNAPTRSSGYNSGYNSGYTSRSRPAARSSGYGGGNRPVNGDDAFMNAMMVGTVGAIASHQMHQRHGCSSRGGRAAMMGGGGGGCSVM